MSDATYVMRHLAFLSIARGLDGAWTLVLVLDGTVSAMRARTTAALLERARNVLEHHDRAHDQEVAA